MTVGEAAAKGLPRHAWGCQTSLMSRIPEQARADVPSITQDRLPDNAVLVDVREETEWAAGRAPHSILIPLSQIESRLDELPSGRPIVVVCRSGARSARVVDYLVSEGYDAVNLTGGMVEWLRCNRPMKHDGPGIPSVG